MNSDTDGHNIQAEQANRRDSETLRQIAERWNDPRQTPLARMFGFPVGYVLRRVADAMDEALG